MHQMSEIEIKAGATILDESKRFSIKTHGLLRVIGIKRLRFGIKGLYLGTLILISKEITSITIKDGNGIAQATSAMEMNSKIMARIIALAILNNRLKIRLFKRILTSFLLWSLNAKNLSDLVHLVLDQMNVLDFFSSIVSIGGLNILKKKETSPKDEGSSIAPGTQSESSLNTSDSPGKEFSGE
jgi:hypothetical protein